MKGSWDAPSPEEGMAAYGNQSIKPTNVKTIETMIGGKAVPVITATYADKHTAFVNNNTEFAVTDKDIVEFYNGEMLGVGQGSTEVVATHHDVLGNAVEKKFTAKSGYFPFSNQYVRGDIAGTGTYRLNQTNINFKFTSADSQMGWVYEAAKDLSEYKYLVIRTSSKQAANAKVNFYTTERTAGVCCSLPLSTTEMETVFDLTQAVYTSKTSNGKPLNLKSIRMVTFSGDLNKTLNVKEMFLSSDPQYDPTGIAEAKVRPAEGTVNVYTVSGQLVRSNVNRGQATQGLTPGLYIVNGAKVIVR